MFRRKTKAFSILFLGVVVMVFYCEFIIYYVVISHCYWPDVNAKANADVLKAFMLTDIHLGGHRKGFGYNFDKWRREWQMHRAFQTIISLHNPDVVFVLGDSFDEGVWASTTQFEDYVNRFYNDFYVPEHIKMFVIAGNHDIGFHNSVRRENVKRFYEKMNSSSVQLLTLKNSHFVLVNSIAMEGDNCFLCKDARNSIDIISEKLDCSRDFTKCKNMTKSSLKYSRPILLQHFPMFRKSDAECNEGDSVPYSEKDIPFTPKIECLSKEATNYLSMKIRPRAVFEGHTHYGCTVKHVYNEQDIEFLEHTIPSFSWRNIRTPKFMLVTISPDDYAINKCGLPREETIVFTAVLIIALTIFIIRKRKL